MTEHAGLLAKALDDALGARINHLFGVLCVADDLDAGLVRFESGIVKALEAHELVRGLLRKMF